MSNIWETMKQIVVWVNKIKTLFSNLQDNWSLKMPGITGSSVVPYIPVVQCVWRARIHYTPLGRPSPIHWETQQNQQSGWYDWDKFEGALKIIFRCYYTRRQRVKGSPIWILKFSSTLSVRPLVSERNLKCSLRWRWSEKKPLQVFGIFFFESLRRPCKKRTEYSDIPELSC